MAQNVYDRADFFEAYGRLPRSADGLAAAPEWPTFRSTLPPLAGRRVADLGCGFGYLCRWAAEAGAASVAGYDLSENMLAEARRLAGPGPVRFERADLETLELPVAAFDLVVSSLAIHYVADVERLFATVAGALAPGGSFVFSTEHPTLTAPLRQEWRTELDGRRVWALDGYGREGPRVTDWLAPGIVKQHRTLATTLNALLAAGLRLRRIEEWRPTPDEVATRPDWAPELDRPTFLLVAADR